MECKYCGRRCRRAGRQKNGSQRYFCQRCQKYQQEKYRYQAYNGTTDKYIRSLSCESVGIRGIARVLGISKGTVSNRIQLLAIGIRRVDFAVVKDNKVIDMVETTSLTAN